MSDAEKAKVAPGPTKIFWVTLLVLTALAGYSLSGLTFYRNVDSIRNMPDINLEQIKEFDIELFADIKTEQLSALIENRIPAAHGSEITLTFKGTLRADKNIVALVNNEMLYQGDKIQGARITDIQGSYISVEYQGTIRQVDIGETITLR